MPVSLLTDAERRALSGLWFTAARPVEGLLVGRHRSPLKGHSTEFHDYRPYAPGDPTRHVDWKLYGRTDRLYIRRHSHDAELAVHLMLDRSASMDFDGVKHEHNKWAAACKLIAAIAHLVIAQQDRLSLTLLGEQAETALPLGGGWAHWQRLCEILTTTRPHGLNHAASGNAPLVQQGGMIVLIGDLLDEPADWLKVVGQWAARRRDVAVFQVLHADELELPFGAALAKGFRAVDSETGRSVVTAGLTRTTYSQRMRRHIERLRSGLSGLGADHQLVRADQSVIEALGRYVSARTALGAGAS